MKTNNFQFLLFNSMSEKVSINRVKAFGSYSKAKKRTFSRRQKIESDLNGDIK